MTISNFVVLFNGIAIFILLACLVCSFYMIYRNDKVYENRIKVIEAITDYKCFCLKNGIYIKVDFDDMEEYDETLYKRPFDFSCEHILPKEKYEIIKGFM